MAENFKMYPTLPNFFATWGHTACAIYNKFAEF